VRYVLEGSVRRSGNQIRVNAQLIDAETDAHLWAERFDGNTSDLFALQDEITARIGNTLNIELTAAEAARPTENPDALDCVLQGRAASFKPSSRENRAEAISLFERALALEPRSVEAQSRLASALAGRVLDYMSDSAAADIARAEELAGQALAASPRSPLAIRLSPRDPNIGMMYFQIGRIHLLQACIDEAIIWLEKARSATPAFSGIRAWLASAYALKGETERAATELAEARSLAVDGRYTSIARARAVGYFGVPKIRALFEAIFLAGLERHLRCASQDHRKCNESGQAQLLLS
jgi:tetratricopeptide (TPR) repeat protein